MKPLYANCPDCRANATHETRQRQLGRSKPTQWRECCAKHAPTNGVFHETIERGVSREPASVHDLLEALARALESK
jgi:hypothetical protein